MPMRLPSFPKMKTAPPRRKRDEAMLPKEAVVRNTTRTSINMRPGNGGARLPYSAWTRRPHGLRPGGLRPGSLCPGSPFPGPAVLSVRGSGVISQAFYRRRLAPRGAFPRSAGSLQLSNVPPVSVTAFFLCDLAYHRTERKSITIPAEKILDKKETAAYN